ncbi:hypothetical protein C5745_07390 [Sphingobacterium haloxyli]|uniref:Uncharacterized protein n=2 Tax=Sphingobacterium haloxyli TaxID=2100533 RepID=A0A2S9J4P1_9SPHI|nr:hypothetical protein C5745_07390 [Sphingobacterium haloxyli]
MDNMILPFKRPRWNFLIIIVLSLMCFPLATYIHEKSWGIVPILNGRENIAVVWMTLVGLGISVGIHNKRRG